MPPVDLPVIETKTRRRRVLTVPEGATEEQLNEVMHAHGLVFDTPRERFFKEPALNLQDLILNLGRGRTLETPREEALAGAAERMGEAGFLKRMAGEALVPSTPEGVALMGLPFLRGSRLVPQLSLPRQVMAAPVVGSGAALATGGDPLEGAMEGLGVSGGLTAGRALGFLGTQGAALIRGSREWINALKPTNQLNDLFQRLLPSIKREAPETFSGALPGRAAGMRPTPGETLFTLPATLEAGAKKMYQKLSGGIVQAVGPQTPLSLPSLAAAHRGRARLESIGDIREIPAAFQQVKRDLVAAHQDTFTPEQALEALKEVTHWSFLRGEGRAFTPDLLRSLKQEVRDEFRRALPGGAVNAYDRMIREYAQAVGDGGIQDFLTRIKGGLFLQESFGVQAEPRVDLVEIVDFLDKNREFLKSIPGLAEQIFGKSVAGARPLRRVLSMFGRERPTSGAGTVGGGLRIPMIHPLTPRGRPLPGTYGPPLLGGQLGRAVESQYGVE